MMLGMPVSSSRTVNSAPPIRVGVGGRVVARLSFLLALLALPVRAAPTVAPEISTAVTDAANVLSPVAEEFLAQALVQLRSERGAQMAVLLVDSTGGEPVDDYAWRVAEKWAGGAQGREDGLLLVLAISDRRARLEVGYGLEGALPDASAARLLEAAGPVLAEARYADAVLGVIQGVDQLLAASGESTPEPWPPPPLRRHPLDSRHAFVFLGLFALASALLGSRFQSAWQDRLSPWPGLIASLLVHLGPMAVVFLVARASPENGPWSYLVAYSVLAAGFLWTTHLARVTSKLAGVLGSIALLVGVVGATYSGPRFVEVKAFVACFYALVAWGGSLLFFARLWGSTTSNHESGRYRGSFGSTGSSRSGGGTRISISASSSSSSSSSLFVVEILVWRGAELVRRRWKVRRRRRQLFVVSTASACALGRPRQGLGAAAAPPSCCSIRFAAFAASGWSFCSEAASSYSFFASANFFWCS